MSGFLRALRGELYALFHRRSLRIGLVLVVLGVLLRMMLARLAAGVIPGGGAEAAANYWPRFAQAAGFGLGLAELATLVLVGAALPREIASAAVRDPMTRGISRVGFVLARGLTALLCPFVLGGAAVLTAALGCAVLYDGGHVVSAPFVMNQQPEAEAAFHDWLAEEGLRPDQLAAWLYMVEEDGLEGAAAAAALGLPAFELPDDYYSFIPILVFLEDEVADGIHAALAQALAPLTALALFAFLLSMLLPTGALASGLATMLVVLFSVFLAPEMGAGASWFFADWLPGIGHDSALKLAERVAEGYTDSVPPDPEVLAAGARATWIQAGLYFAAATALFPRKKL
ncbi:MAG: hypothetical protein ISR76_07585 [Planctomycetes bacterium]|nr:hypothetical protein [Planctomycetota bacterium]MBL7008845.1 hypothetical protein [Planctomycetota bacterium]